MAEQQFNPGVSLAGAVDLEALKHQVKAEPGQAGGAPAAGGYVIDTTENTFQAMVQTSATFPILLLLLFTGILGDILGPLVAIFRFVLAIVFGL